MRRLPAALMFFWLLPNLLSAQEKGNIDNLPVHEYALTIDKNMVNKAGKDVMGMTVNGGIPGPTLTFTEGEYAVITVTNNMDVETSVHWHGLILPNYYDGVPYLTTPPIKPGQSLKYEFPLKQAGTYWYHSHTMLQEQRGVYGSIVIKPKEQKLDYDRDFVIVLSDWINESPHSQLKNLKRGNEWYLIKKGQIQSWDKIIKKKAVGAKLKMLWQRMPDMAISDNYFDQFLLNGESTQDYTDFNPGEKVRVRFINASAATYFWLTFGGKDPLLVAADGQDVVPVKKNKTLIAIAETYDYIVTIPENGKLEILATAQDGSGSANALLGKGETIAAPRVPKPDLIENMKEMMSMKMKMGAPSSKFRPSVEDSIKVMKKYSMSMDMGTMKIDGMQMDDMGDMPMQHDHSKMAQGKMDMKSMDKDTMNMEWMEHGMHMKMQDGMQMKKPLPADKVIGDPMKTGANPEFNYDYLKAPERTEFDKGKPVKELLFNLTGNMNRYVWSINGVPLSESDKIKIKKGEAVRVTLNNLTMMHHPMHLHGHFFRVLNQNGEYSPLKHTVNVAPMQKVVFEFDGSETGDWFFHCHILYHMMSGMARVFSYDTPRDPRMKSYKLQPLLNEGEKMFTWGEAYAGSHFGEFFLTSTNIRNQFIAKGEYGWNKNLEAEVTYERYLNDYFRVFGGVNLENEGEGSLEEIETVALGGVRYLLPMLIDSEVAVDSKLRPRISLSKSTMIFPRIGLFGEFEYQMDFGVVHDLPHNFTDETTWQIGLEYVLGPYISIEASYDNRFGAGAGLAVRF